MIDLLDRGDFDEACNLMRKHIQNTEINFVQTLLDS